MLQIQAEQEYLMKSSLPYQRLSLTTDPVEIIRLCPNKIVFLCLQFCPIGDTVYVCVGTKAPIDPLLPVATNTKNPVPTATASTVNPIDDKYWVIDKLTLGETSRRSLQVILSQHKAWVLETSKFISASSENIPTDFDLDGATSKFESKTVKKAEGAIEEKLRALVLDLEDCFKAIIGEGSRVYRFLHDLLEKSSPTLKSSYTLMMLLDCSLQALPWEALRVAQLFSGRVARDFSIHMIHHRIQPYVAAIPNALAADGSIHAITLSASTVKYIVDPLSEDQGNKLEGYSRNSLKDELASIIKDKIAVGSEKWVPVRKEKGVVSLQDIIVSIDKSTQHLRGGGANSSGVLSLLSYSLGRISSSVLTPMEASSMNLQSLALLICLDMSHNDNSTRRQMSADVLKSKRQLLSEQPLLYSAVLSLSGIGCMLSHSWSVPINSQNRFLRSFLQAFTTPPIIDKSAGPSVIAVIDVISALARSNNQEASPLSAATVPVPASSNTGRVTLIEMTGSLADASLASKEQHNKYTTKKWIRTSRVLYGLPFISYNSTA